MLLVGDVGFYLQVCFRYIPDFIGSSTPTRRPRQNKRSTPSSLERQTLFLGQQRKGIPAARQCLPTVKSFSKTFIILAKKFHENFRMKPNASELTELTDAGLGEQIISFQDDDDTAVVLSKLEG